MLKNIDLETCRDAHFEIDIEVGGYYNNES
jgi:hypothetical protein